MRMNRWQMPYLVCASVMAVAVATPALAAEEAAAEAAAEGEAIVVFGKGETRQVQQVEQAEIRVLTPGSSAIKAIEKLPSVNIQAADPFGNYEWSTRVTIRSFNQNQLGFNFDGIPLGDMSYGNHNGLHISRIVSSENIGSVRVSQGAGALGTQSTNNLGGTVETFSMTPEARLGATASLTYGSDDTLRGFVRAGFGSEDGPAGFVSYGYAATDKYRGQGTQDQHMVNAKAVLPLGDAKVSGWFSYSDRREQDYQDMSLDMLGRLGYSADNLNPDYALAVLLADIGNNRGETGAAISNAAAGTTYPGNYATVDDAYFDASGLRKDTVASLGVTAPLGDAASFELKGYYHHNQGMGLWATPYVASPAGASPISIRTTEYEMDRYGVFGNVAFEIAGQALTVGGWWEHNEFNQARRFYALASRTDPGRSFRDYPTDPFFTQWEFDFTTETLQYFVQDKIDLGAIRINLGWKGFRVTNEAEAVIRASFPEGRIKVQDWFQPHAGIAFELSPSAEIFAGYTEATRSFASATTTGPFSTNQSGFDAIRGSLKPESSQTYEAGLRFNTPTLNAVLGAYLVDFHDRLLAVSVGSSIQGNPSALQNVGGVRAIGLEAAVDLKLGGGWGLYGSYSYTDATYRNDVRDGDGKLIAAIKGKTVVDSPKHMLRGELNYDQDGAFGRIGFNYMTKREFTYTNDRHVPSRLLADAAFGYRFNDRFELQFNISNLFDEQYVATIGSGGYGNSGDRQTLLVGAPRQFFATLKAGF